MEMAVARSTDDASMGRTRAAKRARRNHLGWYNDMVIRHTEWRGPQPSAVALLKLPTASMLARAVEAFGGSPTPASMCFVYRLFDTAPAKDSDITLPLCAADGEGLTQCFRKDGHAMSSLMLSALINVIHVSAQLAGLGPLNGYQRVPASPGGCWILGHIPASFPLTDVGVRRLATAVVQSGVCSGLQQSPIGTPVFFFINHQSLPAATPGHTIVVRADLQRRLLTTPVVRDETTLRTLASALGVIVHEVAQAANHCTLSADAAGWSVCHDEAWTCTGFEHGYCSEGGGLALAAALWQLPISNLTNESLRKISTLWIPYLVMSLGGWAPSPAPPAPAIPVAGFPCVAALRFANVIAGRPPDAYTPAELERAREQWTAVIARNQHGSSLRLWTVLATADAPRVPEPSFWGASGKKGKNGVKGGVSKESKARGTAEAGARLRGSGDGSASMEEDDEPDESEAASPQAGARCSPPPERGGVAAGRLAAAGEAAAVSEGAKAARAAAAGDSAAAAGVAAAGVAAAAGRAGAAGEAAVAAGAEHLPGAYHWPPLARRPPGEV